MDLGKHSALNRLKKAASLGFGPMAPAKEAAPPDQIQRPPSPELVRRDEPRWKAVPDFRLLQSLESADDYDFTGVLAGPRQRLSAAGPLTPAAPRRPLGAQKLGAPRLRLKTLKVSTHTRLSSGEAPAELEGDAEESSEQGFKETLVEAGAAAALPTPDALGELAQAVVAEQDEAEARRHKKELRKKREEWRRERKEKQREEEALREKERRKVKEKERQQRRDPSSSSSSSSSSDEGSDSSTRRERRGKSSSDTSSSSSATDGRVVPKSHGQASGKSRSAEGGRDEKKRKRSRSRSRDRGRRR